MTWLAESLRMTAFLSPEATERSLDWAGLVGEEPESEKRAPRLQQVRQEGNLDGIHLTHRRTPGRIDWYLTAPPSPGDVPRPTLKFSSEIRQQFIDLMNRWLRGGESANRLAFGVVLLKPTAGKDESYRLLDGYLPAVEVDPETFDFSYRINRRRPSISVPAIEINRLSTWSAVQASLLIMRPNTETATRSATEQFCRLELDMSTAPSKTTILDTEQSLSVLQELVTLAVEISETGECP
jgi:hypothetical protein